MLKTFKRLNAKILPKSEESISLINNEIIDEFRNSLIAYKSWNRNPFFKRRSGSTHVLCKDICMIIYDNSFLITFMRGGDILTEYQYNDFNKRCFFTICDGSKNSITITEYNSLPAECFAKFSKQQKAFYLKNIDIF